MKSGIYFPEFKRTDPTAYQEELATHKAVEGA